MKLWSTHLKKRDISFVDDNERFREPPGRWTLHFRWSWCYIYVFLRLHGIISYETGPQIIARSRTIPIRGNLNGKHLNLRLRAQISSVDSFFFVKLWLFTAGKYGGLSSTHLTHVADGLLCKSCGQSCVHWLGQFGMHWIELSANPRAFIYTVLLRRSDQFWNVIFTLLIA